MLIRPLSMDFITKEQARKIDKFAQKKLGISTLLLMENAGRATSDAALEMLKDSGKVAIFCGRGNNGGDGFVCARHLVTRGVGVGVYLAARHDDVKNEARVNLDILKALGISINEVMDRETLDKIEFKKYSLIIDALLGVGLSGEIKGIVENIISSINNSGIPVLSVDIPSGLNADTGEVLGICTVATKTITFVSKKTGMAEVNSSHYCGEILVRDIGLPWDFFSESLK